MTKRLIEMVCTGNNGRSPVAELLANNYLAKIGASAREYGAISSGTAVDQIGTKNLPIQVMKPVVQTGLERGLYGVHEVAAVEDALRTDDADAVRGYFSRAESQFAAEERDHRSKALAELAIPGTPKANRSQTIARPDVVAVFPVDRKNLLRVNDIYGDSQHAPVIDVLSAYATGDRAAEITNTFGKGEEVYRESVLRMIDEVPKAIDRLLKSRAN